MTVGTSSAEPRVALSWADLLLLVLVLAAAVALWPLGAALVDAHLGERARDAAQTEAIERGTAALEDARAHLKLLREEVLRYRFEQARLDATVALLEERTVGSPRKPGLPSAGVVPAATAADDLERAKLAREVVGRTIAAITAEVRRVEVDEQARATAVREARREADSAARAASAASARRRWAWTVGICASAEVLVLAVVWAFLVIAPASGRSVVHRGPVLAISAFGLAGIAAYGAAGGMGAAALALTVAAVVLVRAVYATRAA